MRKFLIICAALIFAVLFADYIYYHTDFYIDIYPDAQVTTFTTTKGKEILIDRGQGYEPFEIRGVDMGAGKPGYYATSYSVTKDEYSRWFSQIQDMGANAIRVYTILSPQFYEAFYDYNKDRDNPLYLIHGLWLNDYIQNSHIDAYDSSYIDPFLEDAKRMIDVIHGRRKVSYSSDRGSGRYRWDVSPWVIGYILGVEWEDVTVAYTDHMQKDAELYSGEYFYASEEASPFESMLCRLGDAVAGYESGRYKEQRLVAFSNWPTTDPFEYDEYVVDHFRKCAYVDVEHIKTTDKFISGQFASYHVYPYYPDYLRYSQGFEEYKDGVKVNTYREYLTMLAEHHEMPVIISEFGVPSSRGMAQIDYGRGFSQGFMSEDDQGRAIVECYEDIVASGCAGCVIFTWQDEWFKRTWNTMHATDLTQTAYWSDYQTNEQYFGLLSFDPGKEKSICYVDGDLSDWQDSDVVQRTQDMELSVKYDEKFIYFLVRTADDYSGPVYIPIDTTYKSGSTRCDDPDLEFEREADFLIVLNDRDESRVLVQERYDNMRAMFSRETSWTDGYEYPPDKDSPSFVPIRMILQTEPKYMGNTVVDVSKTYETGSLTYGNANPESSDFNSLADFCSGSGFTEIKLPWLLLNFSNPSDMEVHDDYYEHYGVENMRIRSMYAGAGSGSGAIPMEEVRLKGWGNNVTYHERLKKSYYAVKEMWAGDKEVTR